MAQQHPSWKTTRGRPTYNQPAEGIPYYTPAQLPPAGTALESDKDKAVPTLFTPLTIRGVTLTNRVVASPMCQYSADDGHLTDYHLVHLGQFALKGVALSIVEATSVTPNGRISPEDSGLWQDSQVAPLKRVADFVHSQGQLIGVQLAHAGRKASSLAPWLTAAGNHPGSTKEVAPVEAGGWPDNVWAPSALAYDGPGFSKHPKATTLDDIADLTKAFGEAAKRAVAAGVDVIELHAAHGYLLHEFLSPVTNHRTDQYGGPALENRSRLLREVIVAVRANIPKTTPLFVRLSATEWAPSTTTGPSWNVDDTIALVKQLPALGVDLIDVSSGGNLPEQQIPAHDPYFQIDLAKKVRDALQNDPDDAVRNLLIGSVGIITNGHVAREVVQKGGVPGGRKIEADLAFVGRQLLREPEFVLKAAHDLDVAIQWPNQYQRAPYRK